MRTFEVMFRDAPDQFIEADYLSYERGDAVFYSWGRQSDREKDLGTVKSTIVAVLPSAAFIMIREKVVPTKEEFVKELKRFGMVSRVQDWTIYNSVKVERSCELRQVESQSGSPEGWSWYSLRDNGSCDIFSASQYDLFLVKK